MENRDNDVRIQGFDLTRAQVLEINCQECGAEPGERCKTESGRIRHDPHFMRKMDRNEGTDPGPTKSRMQKTMESLEEAGTAYLADVLRRAVKRGIISDSQRDQIIDLTDLPETDAAPPDLTNN